MDSSSSARTRALSDRNSCVDKMSLSGSSVPSGGHLGRMQMSEILGTSTEEHADSVGSLRFVRVPGFSESNFALF